MATRDFKVRNGLIVGTTITLNGNSVSRILDSDNVTAIVNATSQGLTDSDLAVVAQLRNDVDSDSLRIQDLQTQIDNLDIAAIRADADSDSIAIQAIRGAVDSDYALFNAKIAAFNGLTDSDLTTVSILRNDLDSESVEIRALRRDLDSEIANKLTAADTGIEVFTIYDSDRLAGIGSPSMGDIAYIPGRSSSGGGVAITSATLSGGVLYAGGTYNYSGGVKGSLAVGSVMIVQNSGAVKGYVVTSLQGSSQEILVAALTTTQIADVWANDMLADFPTMPGQGSVGGASDPVQTVPKFYEGWSSVSNVPGSNPASTTGVVVSGVVGGVTYTSPKAWLYDSDGWDIELVVEGDTNRPEKKVARIEDLFDSDQIVAIINENVVDDTGFDSDQIVAIINENTFASDSDSIINVFQDPDNGLPSIYATVVGPVQFRAKNDSGSNLFPGTAVYIKGISGEVPTVDKANASSGSTMPAFGIVSAVSNNGADCFVTTFGDLKNIDTSAFSIGQTVYISADSDGALTQTKPSGATDLIQNIGLVTRVHASAGSIRVGGSGRTNDIDNATRARLDSDSLAIQGLSTRVNSLKDDIDSETARIQLLILSTDSDALSLASLRRDADSDAAAIVVLKQNAESDSLAIQALSSSLAPRLDSDEQAIQATRTEMDVSFNIVNNGASAYTFTGDGFPSGVDNPTLYLHRGHTYNFRVNASGHPFQIRLSSGGSAYSTGVSNNGAQIGEVKFVVPMDAPETLVYQCTLHSGMVGTIKIGKQGFDSDQIASMILENSSGSGMTDSDLAVVAKLRADVDSDSAKLQALQETVNGLSVSAGFDSDQIVAIINENPTSSGTGMTDSDLKVVADLRNDITALQTSGAVSQESSFTTFKYKAAQGQSTFSGVDRNNQTLSYTAGNINVFVNGVLINDSDDYVATNGTSVVLNLAADSDDVVVIQKMRSTFDSDSVASVFNNNLTDLTITRFDFTATQGQTVFSGSDDNGNSLSYAANKIQVYLNGILLLDTTDYTAVNGTSITLVTAADSDDKLSVIKYLGKDATVSDAINITRFTFKYTPSGGSTVGDSEISGRDTHNNLLSYTAGKIQVYSNGILLEDSDDYVATDGSTITLRAAPDSDDVVSIFKYLGTTQSGFDSDQVVSIISENSSGVTTGKAIAMAIVFGG